MGNGDPLYHLSAAIGELRTDMREMRGEMHELRGDLAQTRESVARIEGQSEGEAQTTDRTHRVRDQVIALAAAVGVILGSVATVAAVVHP